MARVVGWICDQEWMDVYKKIFCDKFNPVVAEHVLDVMSIWRTRFCSRIPVAIEATYRLLEVLVNQQNVAPGAQRQMFSAAVTQFIGLITERGFKNNGRKPIHSVADDMGIPEWLINLRHEMAHGPLPSLVMLEKAVYFGLEWLKEKHWDQQAANLIYLSVPSMSLDIESSLSLDCKLLEVLQTFSQLSNHETHPEYNCIVDDLSNMAQYDPVVIQRLCVVFVSCELCNKLEIADKEKVESSCKSPSAYHMFWNPIIKLVKLHSQLPNLLFSFIHCLCNSKDIVKTDLLANWSIHILGILTEQFSNNYITEHNAWSECIKLLLCNVNDQTTRLFDIISKPLQYVLGKERFSNLNNLRNVFSSESQTRKISEEDLKIVHTLNNVLEICENKSSLSSDNDPVWSLYDGNNLKQCSIGLMPGQKRNYLSRHLFGATHCNEVENVNCEDDLNDDLAQCYSESEEMELLEDYDNNVVVGDEQYVNTADSFNCDDSVETNKHNDAFDGFVSSDWNEVSDSIDLLLF